MCYHKWVFNLELWWNNTHMVLSLVTVTNALLISNFITPLRDLFHQFIRGGIH